MRLMKKLKQLRKRRKSIPVCRTCKHKVGSKFFWLCGQPVKSRSEYEYILPSICGNKKPRTSPRWCPLRDKGDEK